MEEVFRAGFRAVAEPYAGWNRYGHEQPGRISQRPPLAGFCYPLRHDSVAHCASAGKEFSAGRHRPLSAAGVIYRWRKRDPFQVDDRAYSLSCRADFREFLQKVLAWEAA